jgi:hypothetical protein
VLPSTVTARWIVVVCAAMLLLAQVMGLHYHRHVERVDGHAHGSELHFEDGGLHLDEQRADHRHALDAAGSQSGHWHIDVESKVVKPGLLKAFLDAVLLSLLMRVATLVLPAAGPQLCWRPRAAGAARRIHPFSLRPPSQAPPARLLYAC